MSDLLLWLILGPYLLALMACWRMVAGHLAWRMLRVFRHKYPALGKDRYEPSGEQWFGAIVSGLLIACCWPIALAFAKWPITIGAEREADHRAKLRDRDEVIARLEREMDIR